MSDDTKLLQYLNKYPTYVYIVDKDIKENIENLMKINLKNKIVIPYNFNKYIEKLINLTKKMKNLNKNILKIKSLEPVFYRTDEYLNIGKGISFLDENKDLFYNKNTSPFGEFSFGEQRTVQVSKKKFKIRFSPDVATEQLKKNLHSIRDITGYLNEEIWVICRIENHENTELLFAKLDDRIVSNTNPTTATAPIITSTAIPPIVTSTIVTSTIDPTPIVASTIPPPSSAPPPPSANEEAWNKWLAEDFTNRNAIYQKHIEYIKKKGVSTTPIAQKKVEETNNLSDSEDSKDSQNPLLAAIKKGKKLKKVEEQTNSSNSEDSHDALLADIKKGKKLKKVEEQTDSSNSEDSHDALIAAIKKGKKLKKVEESKEGEKKSKKKQHILNETEIWQVVETLKKLKDEDDDKIDWDESEIGDRSEKNVLSRNLFSDNLIKDKNELISYMKTIKEQCNIEKYCKILNNIIEDFEKKDQLWGGKKYYLKYFKYKQKYLDAKRLYNNNLEGGMYGDYTFVFCTNDVYNVIAILYNKNLIFDDKEFFLFLLGPRSFYTEYKSKKICFYWGGCINKFWEDGLGIQKSKLNDNFDIKNALEQIKAKMPDGKITFEVKEGDEQVNKFLESGTEPTKYNYFYFESVYDGFKITFPNQNTYEVIKQKN